MRDAISNRVILASRRNSPKQIYELGVRLIGVAKQLLA